MGRGAKGPAEGTDMTSDGSHQDGLAAMRREQVERIARTGPELSPENSEAAFGLFAAAHQDLGYEAPVLTRDVAYGLDPRQRLDIHSAFRPGAAPGGTRPVPVLAFVHGGGFVGGDKHTPGSPYYDHIGAWAVRRGMVGVTITYRLAPQHQWPAGAQDVGQAVAWVTEHIRDYGGDPERVVVAGHSAGATHVAGYLAGHAGAPPGAAAGALLSGIYELPPGEPKETQAAYFGTDRSLYPSRSPLQGLVASGIPVLFAVAEHDLTWFHQQAALALQAFAGHDGTLPPFAYVQDHNHVSEVAALGIDDEPLGIPLLRFIERVTGTPLPRPERQQPGSAAAGSPGRRPA
jgi:acetyl esterase/lipase